MLAGREPVRWSAGLGVADGMRRMDHHGGVVGAEPSPALVAGLQGPRGAGVGDPPGSAEFAHQVLPQFQPPPGRLVRPPVRDRLQRCEQGLLDAGEGVGPGRGLPVQPLLPVDRAGELPADPRDLIAGQPPGGGVPNQLSGQRRTGCLGGAPFHIRRRRLGRGARSLHIRRRCGLGLGARSDHDTDHANNGSPHW